MITECQYCHKNFKWELKSNKSHRRFCDKCRRLKREMYPQAKYIKKYKFIKHKKEIYTMKNVFGYDEVNVYV